MKDKNSKQPWQLGLGPELEKLLAELGQEVLAENRQRIKEILQEELESNLRQIFASYLPLSKTGCIYEAEEQNDLPQGPEITAACKLVDQITFAHSPEGDGVPTYGNGRDSLLAADNPLEADSGELLYVYCFSDQQELDLSTLPGIDNQSRFMLVSQDEITAVVSKVSGLEFCKEEVERNLQDINWLQNKVQAHQRVIEQVMGYGTVIPLKFCTIYKDTQGLLNFICANYQALRNVFNDLQSQEEWGLKLYCDREKLKNQVMTGQREQVPAAGEGIGYLLRKRLEKQAEEQAERLLDDCMEELYQSLQMRSTKWVVCDLLSREASGKIEEMVANLAFLVKKDCVNGFCSTIEEFESGCELSGILVEASGPWPPYHFIDFTPVESHE